MTTALTTENAPDQARPDKTDKRQAIIEAARTLFTTEGYETSTIADVARKAGVGVGTVYLYFKNKAELLYAVKGDWEKEFLSYMVTPEIQATPHQQRAYPLIKACFGLCARHTEMVQMMGLQPQEVGDWHDHPAGSVAQAIKAFFDEAAALGIFRPVDTGPAAIIAYGMVEGALKQCFLVEGGKDQERYINTLVDALEHWLVQPTLLTS